LAVDSNFTKVHAAVLRRVFVTFFVFTDVDLLDFIGVECDLHLALDPFDVHVFATAALRQRTCDDEEKAEVLAHQKSPPEQQLRLARRAKASCAIKHYGIAREIRIGRLTEDRGVAKSVPRVSAKVSKH
jgi:hypothetical protein